MELDRYAPMIRREPQLPTVSIPVFETSSECAGAAASYVLRQVAYRAGAYAPGIQESLFEELHTAEHGARIDDVARWFASRGQALVDLGYRLGCRPTSIPTSELVAWIRVGRGHRGAVLVTNSRLLYPDDSTTPIVHTVGLSIEHSAPDAEGELAMIDASRTDAIRGPASTLASAHRDRDCLALALHWVGWSL